MTYLYVYVHNGMLSMSSKAILNPAGVCDPMNSTACSESNAWVDCSVDSFECESLKNDAGMHDKNFRGNNRQD